MKIRHFTRVTTALLGSVLVVIVINYGLKKETVYSKSANENIPEYPVNEQGQTYGHAPVLENQTLQEPDLIEARGENGVSGYVKASDLDSEVSNPEEALAYQENIQADGYVAIPLYKSDGKTVIGEFRMYSTIRD